MSMGAGVQTTACLLKYHERYKDGWVIFSDTGDEKPETYWYIKEYIKPFCEDMKLRFVTVGHRKGISLSEYCFDKKTLPLKRHRWYTRQFKVRPINKWLREHGARPKSPFYIDIGFSMDEARRMHGGHNEIKSVVKQYPLIDDRLSREDCYKIIRDFGWPIPVKSGCDFCMFNNVGHFRELARTRPERFAEIVRMEKNDQYYPKFPLMGKGKPTLESILDQKSIEDYPDEEMCEDGYCFR